MKDKKLFSRLYTLLLVFLPILNIYEFEPINGLAAGEFLGIIVLIFMFLVDRNKFLVLSPRSYWIFVIYMIFNSIFLTILIDTYLISETLIRIFKMVFYTILIFYFPQKYLDFDFLKKIYIRVCIVASIYLLLQFLFHFLINVNLPAVLGSFRILHEKMTGFEFNQKLLNVYSIQYRPSGFFTEPAAFCEYVCFGIPILLFMEDKNRKVYSQLLIILVAILCSQSAIGYICLVASFILWFFFTKKKISISTIFLAIFILLIFTAVSIRYGLIIKVIERVSTINHVGASTGTIRVLRGLIVFEKLPLINKLFGIGAGNYAAFVNTFNIVTIFDRAIPRENEYMNLLSMILTYGGIVGFLLYFNSIIMIMKNANKLKKTIFAIFILLAISANFFYTATYIMPMILMSYRKKEF